MGTNSMYMSDPQAQVKGNSPLIKNRGYLHKAILDLLAAQLMGK